MTEIQRNLALGIGIAALVAAGVYWLSQRAAPAEETPSVHATTTTTSVVPVFSVAFDASAPIAYGPGVSAEVRAAIEAKAAQARAKIAANPYDFYSWLLLGVYHKMAGDYAAAERIWSSVADTEISSFASVAYGNLGDLYANFLKNYPKAEENYKKAIAMAPETIGYYRDLYYLYRDLLKDAVKARAILELGLKNNPGNPDLLRLREQ